MFANLVLCVLQSCDILNADCLSVTPTDPLCPPWHRVADRIPSAPPTAASMPPPPPPKGLTSHDPESRGRAVVEIRSGWQPARWRFGRCLFFRHRREVRALSILKMRCTKNRQRINKAVS